MWTRLAVDKGSDVERILPGEHRMLEIRTKGHIGANEIGGGDVARHPGAVIVALRSPQRRKLKPAAFLRCFDSTQPLALSVGLMADRALGSKYLGTALRVQRLLRQRQRRDAAAERRFADRHALTDVACIGEKRLHLRPALGQGPAVHAALHAAVNPLLQGTDLVLAADKGRENAPHPGERQAKAPGPCLQMAALAFET